MLAKQEEKDRQTYGKITTVLGGSWGGGVYFIKKNPSGKLVTVPKFITNKGF